MSLLTPLGDVSYRLFSNHFRLIGIFEEIFPRFRDIIEICLLLFGRKQQQIFMICHNQTSRTVPRGTSDPNGGQPHYDVIPLDHFFLGSIPGATPLFYILLFIRRQCTDNLMVD